uniref:G-protein coupled receptors family 1 profile domain-containing protein n=2 Tax=Acrobeloides nanus TaxID=290746 RepID=A0A914CM67_9BILA
MPSDEFLRIWKICDLVLSYSLHALIVIMYIAAFISYRRMSLQMYYLQQKNRRFLYQAMLNSIPCLLYINCYHFNVATIELFLAELCMVMNPFVYLWFNTELRHDFFSLIHWRRNSTEDAHVAPATPFEQQRDSTRQTTPANSHSHPHSHSHSLEN